MVISLLPWRRLRIKLKNKRPPLSRRQVKFCNLLLKLDKIPRYGRYYTYLGLDGKGEMRLSRACWEYQKLGRWGMHLLDDLGLFWAYIDTLNPGWEDNPRSQIDVEGGT